jgi:SAM-dependent methyltransferase
VAESSYADHFGSQWNVFRKTQLDSFTGFPITRDRLRRCLGEQLWNSLAGKRILECGCGAGRFTEILLGEGALVTSIDLSSAVEANADQFPPGSQHAIAQADIRHLPFASQSFDVVMCLGVVQHTPNPEETIACLYDQVKPGGTLILDHYFLTLSWYLKTAPLFRLAMKRMSPGTAMGFTKGLVNIFLPLHRATKKIPVVRSIVHRISPVMCYYSAYPELPETLQREWALLDTHDSLTDYYKHSRSPESLRVTLEKLGLRDIWCSLGGNGVEVRGLRPS